MSETAKELFTFLGIGGGAVAIIGLFKYIIDVIKDTKIRRADARKKEIENEGTIAQKWEEYAEKMEENAVRLEKKVNELLEANGSLLIANRDLQELNFKLQRQVASLHEEVRTLKANFSNPSVGTGA